MKFKKLGILVTILMLAIAAAIFWSRGKSDAGKNIELIEVTRGEIRMTILATGIVGPENRVEVKPPIPGRIEEVLIKEGEIVKQGQIIAWMSSTERAALIDSARSEGLKELKRWEELYRPTPIVAAIAGTVIQRNVESGQTFTSQDPLFVLSDRLIVKAQVDETDLAQIQLSQAASIVLDAYPDNEFEARVSHIAFDSKTVNNVTTYEVNVLPTNTPKYMRSGMTANVTFYFMQKSDILILPIRAIQEEQGKKYVVVSGPKGEARREITTDLSDGKTVEITSGLKEGEIVIPPSRSSDKNKEGVNPFSPMRRKKK